MKQPQSKEKRIPLKQAHKTVETVVIHFAGDSGDGMQVVGGQFTLASSIMGNDVHTFADFPAEIRAPAGTVLGISGFQLSCSKYDIHTPGDKIDVLVALNPAALKVNIQKLSKKAIIILDSDKFNPKEYKKAGIDSDPLNDGTLSAFICHCLPMTQLSLEAVSDVGLSRAKARKTKNMFALGLLAWLYNRPLEPILAWIDARFKHDTKMCEGNHRALKAGVYFGETAEMFSHQYVIESAQLPKGNYRQITGNQALSLACCAVAKQSQHSLLVSGYPITPASDVLHQVAKYRQWGIKTFQAEDEVAALGAALGAAFGGRLALSLTSGPGLDLKSEMLGLAVMTELPLVLVGVQRAGPSTGMPTKVEQSDLLASMFGRHGECPLVVLAPMTPGDCFYILLEAFKIAQTYMTPVIVLSDAFLANGAEPWRIPDLNDFCDLKPHFHHTKPFSPYQRDPETLARPWAIPGTPGLEHVIGGLEKNEAGQISYDPENHQMMTEFRQQKIERVSQALAPLHPLGNKQGDVLVVSWGSTWGTVYSAVEALQEANYDISAVHLRYINPFQPNLEDLLKGFKTVVVVELNTGQLKFLLRAKFLVDAKGINKVAGQPFTIEEITKKLLSFLKEND